MAGVETIVSLHQSAASHAFPFGRRPPSPPCIFLKLVSNSRIRTFGVIRGGGGSSGIGRQDLYQPFRPPQKTGGSGTEEDLEILRNRQGVWYQYAAVIPRLTSSGYTPSQLDEATGVTGIEQNQLVVAAQVRATLETGGMDPETLAKFDALDGASILYELRVISTGQRISAASFVLERGMDARGARELARAIKDFDRRRRESFWDRFSANLPGDCLAFWWYRQSKEFVDSEKDSSLEKALEFATSSKARDLLSSLKVGVSGTPASTSESDSNTTVATMVSVVRLDMGETSGLIMVPVAEPDVESIKEAPESFEEGCFRIHKSPKAWKGAWVPLPTWKPILEAKSPLAIPFPDRSILGEMNRRSSEKEEMLLVIDRASIKEDFKSQSAYLGAFQHSGELCLRSGGELCSGEISNDVRPLGEVVLALSPEE